MTTKPDDLRPWLGPAWDDLTPDQLDRLCAESDRIAERHPKADDQHVREAALTAAVQYLLGEADIDAARAALTATWQRLALERAACRQIAVMLHTDGASKSESARRAGIDRMTLLKDLGER